MLLCVWADVGHKPNECLFLYHRKWLIRFKNPLSCRIMKSIPGEYLYNESVNLCTDMSGGFSLRTHICKSTGKSALLLITRSRHYLPHAWYAFGIGIRH
jgi:hypothetical protein